MAYVRDSRSVFDVPYAQENGVATAIESIYRDLEYARSLVKRNRTRNSDTDDDEEEEDGTIRVRRPAHRNNGSSCQSTPDRVGAGSSESWSESAQGAPSEDWSVISDRDDSPQTRRSSRQSECRDSSPTAIKRSGLAAAVLSVLPDSLSQSRSQSRT